MNVNKLNKSRRIIKLYRNYCRKLNEERIADFPSTYTSKGVVHYWNDVWENQQLFSSNKEIISLKMILPPPNVTGVLHLGHALTVTIQDILARWHRMKGDSVLWVPGLDHAGIATQAAVEKYLLATKNTTRHDIGREEFLGYVEQWKNEKGNKINDQLRSLGASLDWSKEYFTMSEDHKNAVIKAFIMLYERDLLYRSNDLVNWCPTLRSTLSDIEVDFLESMPGDVAIAVHPDDPRYSHYIGQQVWHPLRETFIPVIQDTAVKQDFGTGAVKITPAHDRLDLEIAQRHGLELINVIDEDGKMSKNTKTFAGLPRFEARKKILDHLSNIGALKQIKDHSMSIPICSRSGDVIEYMVKEQWFLKTKKMAERAINAVKNKEIKIQPDRYEELWFDKLNNIRDWCISRQLWWGHRIPAYSGWNGKEKRWIAAQNIEQARELLKKKYGNDFNNIEHDNDVLDTWFSAALLPLTAMGWPNEKYSKYYPLDLMETGHDILFFWVARMAMLSTELVGKLPFKEVLLHGIVCDSQGKKMSKSRGNVILPEYVIDGISRDDLNAKAQENFSIGILSKPELKRTIAVNSKMFPEGISECGIDALRFTLCAHNIKNEKINFNVIECRTNKFFCNKIWQACRYILLVTDESDVDKPDCLSIIDQWILSRLTMMVEIVNESFEQRNFYKAIAAIKQFFYYEFCDFYLEATKIGLQNGDKNIAQSHQYTLIKCADVSLRTIAPIMPYMSEELYMQLGKKISAFPKFSSIMMASYPTVKEISERNEELETQINVILKVILTIRNILNHVNKKSIREVHIVLNETKDLRFYTDNINLITATTRIKDLKILSLNNYSIHEESICTTEADCRLYYLLTDNDVSIQVKKNIEDKRLQIERKIEKLVNLTSNSYNSHSHNEDQTNNELRIKRLQQELHKYPKFV
ncbi:hypothetical protein PV326_012765 [Microctonus aethiopoides]|nr:hypothetical protein PV326_012765 [Microctonus aethiopoides]